MTEDKINRCEFWVAANRIVCETGKFNHKEAKIPINHSWDLETLDDWLKNYSDRKLLEYLKFGWPLNAYDTDTNESIPPNQQGARQNPNEIKEYLKKELEAGTIIGPFVKNPFSKVARFSPLDTRPKKDSNELRVILNLLYPFENGSVNSSINKEIFAGTDDMTLKYPSVDDLAKIIRKKGRKFRIFIRDLTKAYRQLWMEPSSIHLLGFCFQNKLYFDVTLSMGSRSAAYCCQRTTNAITYI